MDIRNLKRELKDLQKEAGARRHLGVPKSESIQVLRKGESGEERRAALIEKYGTCKGVVFVDGNEDGVRWFTYDDELP
jgi:hypothetical protein